MFFNLMLYLSRDIQEKFYNFLFLDFYFNY